MSAGDIERIADVVVEFVPGDRELAERIAGAVWEHLSGDESHGGDSVPSRAVSAGEAPPRSSEQASRTGPLIHDAKLGTREAIVPLSPTNWPGRTTPGDGDGTSEGDQR